MKSAFFISDIHLTQEASPSGEALLFLIKKAQKEADLFVILGDLFDMWIGRARVLQRNYSDILSEFKKLKQTCRVVYLEGNHDFHLKKYWQDELGFEVYDKPVDLTHAGLKLRLEHGDETNREDHGYLFLRWFLRTWPVRKISENIPSGFVIGIGNRASHQSRRYTDHLRDKMRKEKIIAIGRTHAEKLRKNLEFDLLITGHTHVPDDYTFSGGRLINLGSWFEGPHYLAIDSAGSISNISLLIQQ